MLDLLKSNVLAPLATRLGTLAAGGLLGIGANSTHADWVGTGIAGGFLIAADLGLAWLRKRSIQNKAMAKGAEVGMRVMEETRDRRFYPPQSSDPWGSADAEERN